MLFLRHTTVFAKIGIKMWIRISQRQFWTIIILIIA